MGLLDGQLGVVTGGGSGIGEATCRRMAKEGARVAVIDIDGEAARSVAERVAGVGFTADVADPVELTAAIDAVAAAQGGITLLFNNAGVGGLKPLERYSEEEWARLLAVNLTGTWNGIRAAVPHLRRARGGAIVNMAGTTGVRPTRGEAPYAAAKAAVIALTAVAALEYAPDIRVNCVSPGFVATPLTRAVTDDAALRERIESRIPLGRIGHADEVASVVVFLCSPMAAFVTGQNIAIDGGSLLPSHQSDELLRELLSRWSAH